MEKKKNKNIKSKRSEFLKTFGLGAVASGLAVTPLKHLLANEKEKQDNTIEVTINKFAIKRNKNKG